MNNRIKGQALVPSDLQGLHRRTTKKEWDR